MIGALKFWLYCRRLRIAQRLLIKADLADWFIRFPARKEIKITYPARLALGMQRINEGLR